MNNYYSTGGLPPPLGGFHGSLHPASAPQQFYDSRPEPFRGFQDKGLMGPFNPARRRLNFFSVAVAIFVPWAIFSVLLAMNSFTIRYQQPLVCAIFFVLVLIGTIAFWVSAVIDAKKRARGDYFGERIPSWTIFTCATCLLAWLLAIALGSANFHSNMEPFYDMMNLNVYPEVDPAKVRGQQLMDAGRVMFSDGTRLDLGKSMGFRNEDQYCVVPIVSGSTPQTTYDFWAVGTNCCEGKETQFKCGEYNVMQARAGLRLMRDDLRAYYRLAVEQAESAYNITSSHPLFFTWLQDPIGEVTAYQDRGLQQFLVAVFSHFSFQVFFVIAAALAFSKMGNL